MKKTLALILALVMAFALVACGKTDDAGNGDGNASDKKILLSMGAGSPGGSQQVYVGGCASLVSQYADNVELLPEASGSGGSTADLAAMVQGEAELCFVSNAAAQKTYATPEGAGLRAVWGAFPQEFIIVTNDPNVNNIEDLAGKVVAIGPAGGTPESSSHEVFDCLGIDAELITMQWSDCFTSLAEGKVDAVTGACGNPTSALMEAETMFDCHWVSFTDEQMDKILSTYNHFGKVSMTTDYYTDLKAEMGAGSTYDTLGIWMCVYSREDVSEEGVYQVVKAVMDHHDELVSSTHAAAAYTIPEAVKNAGVPLHKGALRYYQEIGVEIPAELIDE